MEKYTIENFMKCIDRAESLGMYFVQCDYRKDLCDVYDSEGDWVCFHNNLVKYFQELDHRNNEQII